MKIFIFSCLIIPLFFLVAVSSVLAQAVDQDQVTITAYVASENSVVFSGLAGPLGHVFLLRNGMLINNTFCDSSGNFQLSDEDIMAGDYIFGLYFVDSEGLQSSTMNITVSVSQGTITLVSGILLPPTLKTNKAAVVKGESIIFSGQTAPGASVSLEIDNGAVAVSLVAGTDGVYYYTFDSSSLIIGTHEARAFSSWSGTDSNYSRTVDFEVVEKKKAITSDESTKDDNDEDTTSEGICSRTDLNDDSRTNIIDFSILLYWYKKENIIGSVDLNSDGDVDFTDFSIQVYCWTG